MEKEEKQYSQTQPTKHQRKLKCESSMSVKRETQETGESRMFAQELDGMVKNVLFEAEQPMGNRA